MLFTIVITLYKSVSGNIYITLTERTTLSNANYLLYAKHRGTNEEVAFVLPANTSSYTYRYDRFAIPSTPFTNSNVGFWDYTIYEQASGSNVDPAQAGDIVETGYLQLLDAPAYTPTVYAGDSSQYTFYNG